MIDDHLHAPDQPPEVLIATGHCARCGEPERHFVTINDRDYCEACSALVRLDQFHERVTSER